jgi:hypothetical protein
MPWYFYPLEFLSAMFVTNGIPHFVQGLSGNAFQSPFAQPPGVGESSAVVNVLWGFANLTIGAVLLWFFSPQGRFTWAGWIVFGIGSLLMSVMTASHFGKVRAARRQS